ncbi:hypothetical protein B9Z55_025927 [Caenorhabditis nigoni]|uniref:Uncharacterized protein n=1 Tax=Caenorhabditis nigoni TaxID=1611254 RepID=A0A2G5T0I0_9PELO|nr:hypothetical protein B9Z55_025927 [Caenorhabditis nigoni]
MDRTQAFEKAKSLAEAGTLDEAFEAIEKYTSEDGIEYTLPEMQIINIIVCEKLTRKSAEWLELYIDAVYDVFSKLSRYARDEERNEVWNRIKEIYYELTLAAKKVWKEKNAPGGLEVYVSYAKLVKSYLDVADEDSYKICETYAKEAKFVGKGTLEDEDFRDAKKSIDTINKMITDAKHEKELIQDSD